MDSLINWVKLKINLSKEFSNFDLKDVLESLLLQSLSSAVAKRNVTALHRLGHIMKILTSAGYLESSAQLEAEFEIPLESPEVAVALHEAGIVDLGVQLDVTWKDQVDNIKS